jgi:two-component system, NtrC family, nitrogen regulation sensor histidine kinase GlnL
MTSVHPEIHQDPELPGLDAITTPVVLIDAFGRIGYINPAAENLFAASRKQVIGMEARTFFSASPRVLEAVDRARDNRTSYTEHEVNLMLPHATALEQSCTATSVELPPYALALEFHPSGHSRILREEQMLMLRRANQELLRNLAHEIKNPLGGLRGAAQLLERELPDAALREYTRVIIQEADRLQGLMDRLLTPNRTPQMRMINIHEVLERVRTLILAEVPEGIDIRRDYDVSLPEIQGDVGQLIQAVLNVVRNAVQALQGKGEILLKTRVARQATLAMRRVPVAVRLEITDNGPGVPEEIRDRIFYPLVSGRAEGTGLGLALAQTLIHQHQGAIELESQPGRTSFIILLPLAQGESRENHTPAIPT